MDNNITEFDHHEHHHHHHHNHSHHYMPMYFFTTYDKVIVLFEKWKITDIGTLLGSVVAIICLAILYELIKVLRVYFTKKSNAPAEYSTVEFHAATEKGERQILKTMQTGVFTVDHVAQTLMYTVQLAIGYLLMLIFMGYSVWLCIAIVTGSALGYFLFGVQRESRSIERKCVVERRKCDDQPCHELTSCNEK